MRKGGDSAFEVEPSSKVSVMAHSYIYATVTFRPMAIQSYSACFEAVPDSAKTRPLTFELYGEGNLPQVSVTRPMLRNSRGQCCMLFQRLSLPHHQTLPLTLKNTGNIPATVRLEMVQGESVFIIQPPSLTVLPPSGDEEPESTTPPPTPLMPRGPVSVHLDVGESRDCPIRFRPRGVLKYRGELTISIVDNMFERLPVHMIGEGYEDDVCIDGVRGQVLEDRATEPEELPDDVEGKFQLFSRPFYHPLFFP